MLFYSWVPGIFRNCKSVQILPPPASLPALLLWPPPLCSTARCTGPARGHLQLVKLLHTSHQISPPPFAFALELSPHCHAPRSTRRLPPRRCRGPLRIEPGSPISRAHQNPGALLDLVPSLSRRFANPRPQNTTRHHHCRRRAGSRRGATTLAIHSSN